MISNAPHRSSWSVSISWFCLLLLVGQSSQRYQGTSAFQQLAFVPSKQAVKHISTQRVTTKLQMSSCPVLEFTKPSNVTTATLTLPSAEEKAFSKSEAKAPKLLGRWSGYGFVLASLRGKPHKYLARLQRKHGPNFIIRPNIVVLNDPKAIRDVLETHNLPKTPKVRFGYKSIFYGTKSRSSGGILAAPWKKWLEQRRMAAPALAESVIGSLAPKLYDVSLPMFEHLDAMAQQKQTVDMSMAFNAVTMDAIGNILLGKSFGMCQQLNLEGRKVEVPFATALHRLTGKYRFLEIVRVVSFSMIVWCVTNSELFTVLHWQTKPFVRWCSLDGGCADVRK